LSKPEQGAVIGIHGLKRRSVKKNLSIAPEGPLMGGGEKISDHNKPVDWVCTRGGLWFKKDCAWESGEN